MRSIASFGRPAGALRTVELNFFKLGAFREEGGGLGGKGFAKLCEKKINYGNKEIKSSESIKNETKTLKRNYKRQQEKVKESRKEKKRKAEKKKTRKMGERRPIYQSSRSGDQHPKQVKINKNKEEKRQFTCFRSYLAV